ncbi:HemK2/MTQ2 family protein methyltransferase [Candidatus Aenigmatarchaeota archaeon]
MVYEPMEDSFLLAKDVKKHASGKVLDMGSGSGILAHAAIKASSISCTDIDINAVNILRKRGLNAFHSNLFSSVTEKFDTIVFNPPYLPQDDYRAIDRTTIGGEKGNETINHFLKDAKRHLNEDGKILILFSSLTPGVIELFKKYGYEYKKLSEQNLFFETLYTYLLH